MTAAFRLEGGLKHSGSTLGMFSLLSSTSLVRLDVILVQGKKVWDTQEVPEVWQSGSHLVSLSQLGHSQMSHGDTGTTAHCSADKDLKFQE